MDKTLCIVKLNVSEHTSSEDGGIVTAVIFIHFILLSTKLQTKHS